MDRILEYKIDSGEPITVSAFLRGKGYSGSLIKRIKQTPDGLTVLGQRVFTNYILNSGDVLTVKIAEERPSDHIVPVNRELDIVYEDEDLLVINKPPVMPVHPVRENRENTLANAVCSYFARQGLDFVFRAPHRLDRDTSGLIIVAKNPLSACVMFNMIKRREIVREYLAIVQGKAPAYGEIDAPIARDKDSILRRCVDFEKGEYAKTYFECLETSGDLSLLKATLYTGRTHQIRVHFKQAGFPIIGDFLYCNNFDRIQRQALHCHHLSFQHPITFQPLEFFCPMPQDMQSAFYI